MRSAISPRDGVLPGDRERQRDVLAHVEERDQVEGLEDEPGPVAAQPRGAVVGELADDLALEDDLAARGPVEAAEQLQERALAAARRAHERDELTGGHGQGDAAQRVDGRLAERVRLGQVAAFEDRAGRDGRGAGHGHGLSGGAVGPAGVELRGHVCLGAERSGGVTIAVRRRVGRSPDGPGSG